MGGVAEHTVADDQRCCGLGGVIALARSETLVQTGTTAPPWHGTPRNREEAAQSWSLSQSCGRVPFEFLRLVPPHTPYRPDVTSRTQFAVPVRRPYIRSACV